MQPGESPCGLAGVFSIVPLAEGHPDATPPPHTVPVAAIPEDLMVYALPAPPVYFIKLTDEPWR